jgi:BlaI family penicillinase repressor
MARKKSQTLTDGELRIMNEIWELEEASVHAVTERLCRTDKVAYNTVQTMLRILEEKGFVAHQKQGRAFMYHPVVNRSAARTTALQHMIKGFFGGSPHALFQNLLADDQLDAMEIEAFKTMIQQAEQDPDDD